MTFSLITTTAAERAEAFLRTIGKWEEAKAESPEKEFARRMVAIAATADKDAENAHGLADDLMCDTLTALGYAEGIAAFDKMKKWYS